MKSILFILIFLFTNYLFAQTILYVDASSTAIEPSGNDWDNAYPSLQTALERARDNANSSSLYQIWVAKGTYKPSSTNGLAGDSRYYHFRMINYVSIYGGFAGDESSIAQRTNYGAGEVNETILSGDLSGDDNYSVNPWTGISENCYHIFYHPSDLVLTSTAILDGFILKGGSANSDANPHNRGAGIYNNNSSPTVTNVSILYNAANYSGAGICNQTSSSPTLTNVTISHNIVRDHFGAGIFNHDFSSPTLTNVTISYNTVGSNGGGMYNYYSSPTLTNVTISYNTAGQGGGMQNYFSSPVLTNVIISNNTATGTAGGIINQLTSSPILNNVTIAKNSGNYGGGISNNSADCSPTLNNCIIWGNTATTNGNQFYVASGTVTLNYSCYSNGAGDVFGSISANNSITSDPQFVDAANNDFRITGMSPCLDVGNGAYNSQDYDIRGIGFPRKLNKETGAAGTIDMGAYEYKVGDDPLPVELAFFEAELAENGVMLKWQTATEVNNFGFDIERSVPFAVTSLEDSLEWSDWSKLGFVEGNGTSNSPKEYDFVDSNLPQVNEVRYRLKQIDNDGSTSYSKTVTIEISSITGIDENGKRFQFTLKQNYPNPFNPSTIIKYSLKERSHVTIKIFNILGEAVLDLFNSEQPIGMHEIKFNASTLSSGVYFYTLYAKSLNSKESFKDIKKMVLLR